MLDIDAKIIGINFIVKSWLKTIRIVIDDLSEFKHRTLIHILALTKN